MRSVGRLLLQSPLQRTLHGGLDVHVDRQRCSTELPHSTSTFLRFTAGCGYGSPATSTMMAVSTFAGASVGVQGAAGHFAARSPTALRRPERTTTTQQGEPSVRDVLVFSGPAPERINGRLAMVGIVAALSVEAGRGEGLLSQLGSGTGQAWFASTVVALSVASLVPLLQGESAEGRAGAVMNANAELWNGRFSMLGLVALAVTEIVTGAPFINV